MYLSNMQLRNTIKIIFHSALAALKSLFDKKHTTTRIINSSPLADRFKDRYIL
jgi:hypothetical protein